MKLYPEDKLIRSHLFLKYLKFLWNRHRNPRRVISGSGFWYRTSLAGTRGEMCWLLWGTTFAGMGVSSWGWQLKTPTTSWPPNSSTDCGRTTKPFSAKPITTTMMNPRLWMTNSTSIRGKATRHPTLESLRPGDFEPFMMSKTTSYSVEYFEMFIC